jgi:cysteine synthase A
MKMHKSIRELIGNTPLLELSNYERDNALKATIAGKLEYFNPAGSVKDRNRRRDGSKACERSGGTAPELGDHRTHSGTTRAWPGGHRRRQGLRLILTMPETMSVRTAEPASGLTARMLVLTEAPRGLKGAIEKAEALAGKRPAASFPASLSTPANPSIPPAYHGAGDSGADTDGKVDILVGGVGTGGYVTGAGEFLKS